jgi:hypothetical protein
MKKTLLLVIVLLSTTGFSQQNYSDYWRNRIKVEENILDSNYFLAQAYYDSIYQKYSFIYAMDAVTGVKLAVMNNDSIRTKGYLMKCIEMGVPIQVIKDDPFLVSHNTFSIWKGVGDFEIDSLQVIYSNRINEKLWKVIDSLFQVDQKYTQRVNKNFVLNYFQWRRAVKRNANIIKEIIQKYGFPGQKILGLHENRIGKDTLIIAKNYYPVSLEAHIMLIHYFSDYVEDYKEFDFLFVKEMDKGNLQPVEYAHYKDFQARWKFSKRHNQELFYNEWHNDPDTTRIDQVNDRRKKLGLCDIKHKERVRNYRLNYNYKWSWFINKIFF